MHCAANVVYEHKKASAHQNNGIYGHQMMRETLGTRKRRCNSSNEMITANHNIQDLLREMQN